MFLFVMKWNIGIIREKVSCRGVAKRNNGRRRYGF